MTTQPDSGRHQARPLQSIPVRDRLVDLAIDIGQTQARIQSIHEGRPGVELQVDGFAYGSNLLDTVEYIVHESARRVGASIVAAVAVGSTGLYGRVPAVDELFGRLQRDVGTTAVVVADDALTAYLGALGDQDGVVVSAGTGIVGLAHGPVGTARVDGAGSMIGDEGSGWWIGRQGLISAISAADGRRGASQALLARLEERFGAVADFPAHLAATSSPVAVVASFAKDVADVARDGDAIAVGIWRQAGEHIGDVIFAAATRAGLGRDPQWTLIGRLSNATDLLKPGLENRLSSSLPHSTQVAPMGKPLDGVRKLLSIDPTSYGPMVRSSGVR